MILSLLLGVAIGAVSVIFALQNISVVTVTFMSWQITAPLALVLLGSILSGVVVMLLVLLPSVIRDEMYLSALKRQKKEAEEELARYRMTHPETPTMVTAVTA